MQGRCLASLAPFDYVDPETNDGKPDSSGFPRDYDSMIYRMTA